MKYLFSGDIQYYSGRKQKKKYMKKVLVILLVVLVVMFSAGSFLMIHDTYQQMFGRADRPERTVYQTYEDIAQDYSRTEISFSSQGNTLKGYLYGPKKAQALVVISHGMGDGADGYIKETAYFAKRGFKVLAFDNTGSYDSEGDGIMGLSQSVIDLDAALSYVEHNEELKKLPVLLYGHSWGGWAVASILHYDHDITAAVSVAGYNSPMEIIMDWVKEDMGLLRYVEYPYIWIYQKALFGGAANLSAADCINETDTPVLIMQGTEDKVVDCDTVSIMAHQDEITNPNVRFIRWSEEGQNGHSDLFLAPENAAYRQEVADSWKALQDEYDGHVPEGEEARWYASVDKARMSKLDEVFMQNVYQFFKEALEE